MSTAVSELIDEVTSTEVTSTSPAPLPVATAIARAAALIGGVAKQAKNRELGYAFRGIADIAPKVQRACAEVGLSITPESVELVQLDRGTTHKGSAVWTAVIRVTWSLRTEVSALTATTYGMAADTSDKALSKAHTAAWKTLLIEVFAIGDPADDADGESPEVPSLPQVQHLGKVARPAPKRSLREQASALLASAGISEADGAELVHIAMESAGVGPDENGEWPKLSNLAPESGAKVLAELEALVEAVAP